MEKERIYLIELLKSTYPKKTLCCKKLAHVKSIPQTTKYIDSKYLAY